MTVKNKTTETDVDVTDFINSYAETEQKKADSFRLVELMRKWSGFEPKMWGPSIIGFGNYHYKYPSGHEGDYLVIGFSPRKSEFSLYVSVPGNGDKDLIENLGKYKMGKACIYVKRLSDIDLDVLEMLCKATIRYIGEKYGSQPR